MLKPTAHSNMRQVGGDFEPPRPRKRSSVDLGHSTVAASTPTSFMLGTERDVETHLDRQDSSRVGQGAAMDAGGQDSVYGVRSMDDSELAESAVQEDGSEPVDASLHRPETPRRRSTIRAFQTRRDESLGALSAVSGLTSEASGSPGKGKAAELVHCGRESHISQPLTPLSRASPGPYSGAPGSPRSISVNSLRHPEDEEYENGSQAVFSSGSEDSVDGGQYQHSSPGPLGLQLVMPSLTLPSRRPFTDRGKQLGRLKLLFAGASGSGKTSLIKSFVQNCSDIVHIDPQPVTTQESKSRSNSKAQPSSKATKKIGEIIASTKPYPQWWSEVEESQVLRRRKSSGEEVLERNVCFIDTPGYDNGSSMLEGMESVLQYIESQMQLTISTSAMHDHDLLSVLGGSGGTQVDAVLYLLPANTRPVDLEFIQQLGRLTNVIPLLSKTDLLQEDTKTQTRAQILEQMRSADISLLTLPDGAPPLFDVCSSPSNDLESMDASLLMASDYIQPLHHSDLPLLIDYLFEPSNVTFLKHLSARKLVSWRKSPPTRSFALTPSPLRTNLFAPTMPLSSNSSSSGRSALSPTSAALTYTSARLTDHKQREERMAQINLGNWAEGLRRNLAAERSRYESIANAEREKWLRERLQECVFDSKIVSNDKAVAYGAQRSQFSDMCSNITKTQKGSLSGRHDALDPFALMLWRRRALTALQVIGGFSILSAFALGLARTWQLDWEWLDGYGLSRLQSVFGFQLGSGPGAGATVGKVPSDW